MGIWYRIEGGVGDRDLLAGCVYRAKDETLSLLRSPGSSLVMTVYRDGTVFSIDEGLLCTLSYMIEVE
jgi:hypothetical protein